MSLTMQFVVVLLSVVLWSPIVKILLSKQSVSGPYIIIHESFLRGKPILYSEFL